MSTMMTYGTDEEQVQKHEHEHEQEQELSPLMGHHHKVSKKSIPNNTFTEICKTFTNREKSLMTLVCVITFVVIYGMVYGALTAHMFEIPDSSSSSRRMDEVVAASATMMAANTDCVKGTAIGTGIGTGIGVVAVPLFFLAIGLSPIGPIAGGFFAANMGAGLAAGSTMAGLQAAAMTGAGVGTAAAVGGAAGTAAGVAAACT
jgi:hypothetical protein